MKKIFHFVSSPSTLFLRIFVVIVPLVLFFLVLLGLTSFLVNFPFWLWVLAFLLFLAWIGVVYAELAELSYLNFPFTFLGGKRLKFNAPREEKTKSYVCEIDILPKGENSRYFRLTMSAFTSTLHSKISVCKDGLLINISPWKRVFLYYLEISNIQKNEYLQKEFIIEHRHKELRGDLLIRSKALYKEIMERWNANNMPQEV